jgi:predicted nucleic acid-binding protein
LTRFVLDASVTLCWLFDGQATNYNDSILERLASGDAALTAVIWPLEVANVLAGAERRKLIRAGEVAAFVEELRQLPIEVDRAGLHRVFDQVLGDARRYRLSTYDTSYLELAMREALPLASVDRALRNAARAAGVTLI